MRPEEDIIPGDIVGCIPFDLAPGAYKHPDTICKKLGDLRVFSILMDTLNKDERGNLRHGWFCFNKKQSDIFKVAEANYVYSGVIRRRRRLLEVIEKQLKSNREMYKLMSDPQEIKENNIQERILLEKLKKTKDSLKEKEEEYESKIKDTESILQINLKSLKIEPSSKYISGALFYQPLNQYPITIIIKEKTAESGPARKYEDGRWGKLGKGGGKAKRNKKIRRTRKTKRNKKIRKTQRRKTQRRKIMIGGQGEYGDGVIREENPVYKQATLLDLFDDISGTQQTAATGKVTETQDFDTALKESTDTGTARENVQVSLSNSPTGLNQKYENFKRKYDELSKYYETIKSVFELIDEENMNSESLSALFKGQLKKIKFLYCATLIFLIKLLRDIKNYSVIAYIPKIKDLYNDFVEKIKTKIDLLKKYNYGLQKENIRGLNFYSNNEYCKNLFNNDYITLTQIITYTLKSLHKTEPVPIELDKYKQHIDHLADN